MIISYEEQILSVVNACFADRSCHMQQNTFYDIVGKGTLFRPHNCTRTRMAMIIGGLNSVADTLSVLDYTIEGQKERMDQLYCINDKYVNLTEIVRRYIDFDKSFVCFYFTRAGKTTPAFYNEHYPDIMRAITYELPKLIRDAAAHLARVYQID